MLIAFFDTDKLVHHEYFSRGYMVNKEFYITVLQYLHDAVRRHRPEKWRSSNWICTMTMSLLTGLSPQMNSW
jgi:hypothetical protein